MHTALDLPPPYTPIALREAGDAFAHACAVAAAQGAGTLVWVRRFDLVECAVVFEPEEVLATARQVLFAGMNAAADALAAIAPPEKPLVLDWPDAIRFDSGLIGGGRLGWPTDCAEGVRPDWLVFGLMLRAALTREPQPGAVPPAALIDEGFEDFEVPDFIASFARHLMVALDEWASVGPQSQPARWRQRGRWRDGDLALALRAPSWLDPATGEPIA
ncbi:biotin/lipoate--protein ligase family protein [Limobrevibacterium gyesilva]|uniref:Biotin/lipoate--protein ligase family protein n=1 Tax=Limobrevibacterium gyesilva TaxID=2991712 RepID=A0AA41YKQ3_9PROT|nr:biotin/lipoate--protein ligase family protein [Limobrevibacterium gyesilva]MCW3474161.1 biotin/lipoate--protein ligase family protein [Limobrevibacterium gyesilva]